MNKKIMLITFGLITLLLVSNLASAWVIRDVEAERKAEWQSYERYVKDYVEVHNLEGYEDYLYEPNLQANFGFKHPSHYYVPPEILWLKENTPLTGEVYNTPLRGTQLSLNNPSAVAHYAPEGEGYVPATAYGKHFDHPHATLGYVGTYTTNNYPNYNMYAGYGHGYVGTAYPNQPAYYARVSEPLGNQYSVITYY